MQIFKSVLITSPTGFDITFTNVEDTLKQLWDKVVSKLFQRCFNVGHRRCLNVVQRGKFDVGSTPLKQRWSDVEMLAGEDFVGLHGIILERCCIMIRSRPRTSSRTMLSRLQHYDGQKVRSSNCNKKWIKQKCFRHTLSCTLIKCSLLR